MIILVLIIEQYEDEGREHSSPTEHDAVTDNIVEAHQNMLSPAPLLTSFENATVNVSKTNSTDVDTDRVYESVYPCADDEMKYNTGSSYAYTNPTATDIRLLPSTSGDEEESCGHCSAEHALEYNQFHTGKYELHQSLHSPFDVCDGHATPRASTPPFPETADVIQVSCHL